MAAAEDRHAKLIGYLNATAALVRSDDPDLTGRQMTVLLKVYLDDSHQTVRGLAAFAHVSKPAITRALDRLGDFDLIRRQTDPLDRRSVIVQRTNTGRAFVGSFGDTLSAASTTKIEDSTKSVKRR